MQRFVLILLVWLGIIIVALNLLQPEPERTTHKVSARFTQQVAILKASEQKYQQQDYQAALRMLEMTQALFTDAGVPDELALGYYLLKGKVHWSLWEYVEADQSWQLASRFAVTTQQKHLLQRLTRDSERVVSDINRERNERQVYLASPHVGPAAELSGKIVLIYVYLVDATGNDWSLRDRTYVQQSWRMAQAWLGDKAREYGGTLSFSQRLFLVNKNPKITRLRIGDVGNHFRNVDQVVSLAAQNLGYPDILTFTERIKQEEHADQAMLFFHLGRDGRSFASRCMQRCANTGEFVVLLESARAKKWQSLQYAQAHESLHLFGADDLYNIQKAKYYAVRDIMNYPSSRLQASTLEPLTAWSIGLSSHKPDTPFKLKVTSKKYNYRGGK